MFLMAVNKTLSNEELIKEMQEKVVALQDHEISFLNDTIANMWAAVGIGVGIVVGIVGFIGWLINRSKQDAEEKMQLAEQILGDAQAAKEELMQYKVDLEVYREETRKEFEELTQLVNSAEIEELKEDTKILTAKKKIESSLAITENLIEVGHKELGMLVAVLMESPSGYDDKLVNPFEEELKSFETEFKRMRKMVVRGEYNSTRAMEIKLECSSFNTRLRGFVLEMHRFYKLQGGG